MGQTKERKWQGREKRKSEVVVEEVGNTRKTLKEVTMDKGVR